MSATPIRERRLTTAAYLRELGLPDLPPRTHPFDPGYDPQTVISHLGQSAHLMASLKISMACWLVGGEEAYRSKIAFARQCGVTTVAGGGPFEIAVALGKLDPYLALCADMGIARIEAGQGFTDMPLAPAEVARRARAFGLGLQFELGKKHTGAFGEGTVDALIEQGRAWLDAGAVYLVVEARESGAGVGVFDPSGALNREAADRLAAAFGLDRLVFEAPNKPSQFALLRHFGDRVALANVRLEEVLRVEIFRRGLHSDAFDVDVFMRRLEAAKAQAEAPEVREARDSGIPAVPSGLLPQERLEREGPGQFTTVR
jgi:phosphosulfolactate synthase